LYNLDTDFSQAQDLAAKFPDRLSEMKQAFDVEAQRNGVYPMIAEIGNHNPKPSLQAGRTTFTFHRHGAPIPSLTGAPLLLGPHQLTAEVILPANRPAGMIVSNGGREGGFGLYIDDEGHLVYVNNYGGKHRDVIRSTEPMKTGRARIDLIVAKGERGFQVQLEVDDALVAEGAVPRIGPPSYLGAFCVGRSCGSPVGLGYNGSFEFPGEIVQVDINR
jgi:arylsulfatase